MATTQTVIQEERKKVGHGGKEEEFGGSLRGGRIFERYGRRMKGEGWAWKEHGGRRGFGGRGRGLE